MSMRVYRCRICHVYYMEVNAFLNHKRTHTEKSTGDGINENILPNNTIGIETSSNIKINEIKPVEKIECLDGINSPSECEEYGRIETKKFPTNNVVLVETPQPSGSPTNIEELKNPVSGNRNAENQLEEEPVLNNSTTNFVLVEIPQPSDSQRKIGELNNAETESGNGSPEKKRVKKSIIIDSTSDSNTVSVNESCSTKTDEMKKPGYIFVRPIRMNYCLRPLMSSVTDIDTNSTKVEEPVSSYSLRSRSLTGVALTQSKSNLDTQQNSESVEERKRKNSSKKACDNLKNLSEPKMKNLDVKRIKLELNGRQRRGRPGKKATKCAFCDIDLVEPIDYQLLRTCAVETPPSCPDCKNTYADLKILIRHYFREKRFACSSCKNIFKRKSGVISHFRVHTKIISRKDIKSKLEQNSSDSSKSPEKVTKMLNPNKIQKKSTKPKLQLKTNTNNRRKLQSSSPSNPNLNNSSTLELLESTDDKEMNVFLNRDTRTNWSLRHLSSSVREVMLLQQKPAGGRIFSERMIDLEFDKQTKQALAESLPSNKWNRRITRTSMRSSF